MADPDPKSVRDLGDALHKVPRDRWADFIQAVNLAIVEGATREEAIEIAHEIVMGDS